MESKHMMRNIGIGMAAGAALGMLMAPQKKTMKATAKKARRARETPRKNIPNNRGKKKLDPPATCRRGPFLIRCVWAAGSQA